jgi:transposase
MDESAFRRRFGYHTVVSDPEDRRVLDLVEGRSQASATQALQRLPMEWRPGIETVVIDLFWPYRKAIEAELPEARIVADKFHVLRAVDRAAHMVRIRHGRRRLIRGRDGGLSRLNNPRFDPRVWRNRWTFTKRHHQLS